MSNELYEERFFIPLWAETHIKPDEEEKLIQFKLAEQAISQSVDYDDN